MSIYGTLTNYGYNCGGLRVHAPNFLEETSIIWFTLFQAKAFAYSYIHR